MQVTSITILQKRRVFGLFNEVSTYPKFGDGAMVQNNSKYEEVIGI
jgi:hypothetical protein